MKVFYCIDFTGVWPTGTCALVVAPTAEEARKMLAKELTSYGLKLEESDTLAEVDLSQPRVEILLNGDY